MGLAQIQKEHLEKQTLMKAAEKVNKVHDSDLAQMIHRFDYTPASELKLDVNDHMKIYNWLKELELYHGLYGSIGG